MNCTAYTDHTPDNVNRPQHNWGIFKFASLTASEEMADEDTSPSDAYDSPVVHPEEAVSYGIPQDNQLINISIKNNNV